MIRKCYLLLVTLALSVSSRGEHANVQNSVVGVSTGTLIRNGSGSVSSSLDTVGDPSLFGTNAWNVYAWNSTNANSWIIDYYAGYYVDTNLSMFTLNYWGDNESPSYAPGYQGQGVIEDDHSFSAKRRGFPSGYYHINIPSHDDWAYLIIDGVEVWNHEDCCDYHSDVWEGFLGDTTTIEFRVMEFGGGSYGFVELVRATVVATATTTFIPCLNGTSDVTISAIDGVPPFTGTGTFTVPAGTYDYTVTDSLGDSTTITVVVAGPLDYDSVITTNVAPEFCAGDTVILTAPSHGKALNFTAPSRVLLPINSPETDYTFELDFKTTEPYTGISSVRDGDLGGSHDRNLYLEEGEIFHRLYSSDEIISSTGQNYADGQWHHVAVVVESGVGQKIYVDGILVASGIIDRSDFDWDNTINIGFANDWFNGSIDNVRLWDVVRTPSEIIQDQTLHAVGSQPGLIGNWDFDEISDETMINSVDNSLAYLMDSPSAIENNTNTYLWSNGETTQSIALSTAGTYTVAVTNANGCAVGIPAMELILNPSPATPVISTQSSLSFCHGSVAEFTSSATEGNQWLKNGTVMEEDTLSTLEAGEEGNYSVVVTNSFGCTNTSASQFLEVFPAPQAPIIIPSSATTFCEGGSVDLTVHSGNVNVRWASSVISFSSEWEPFDWGAIQALGEPDLYPNYGDIETAWSPAGHDDQEFLELGFAHPIPINFIDIYETFGPDFVDTVFVKNPNTDQYEIVYTAIPEYKGDSSQILHITFPMTSFPVSEVMISMDMSVVLGWNEVDAVSIGNDLPTSYLWTNGDTLQTLNASASATYTVTVVNSIGCTTTSEPIEIIENANPVVTAGPDMYSGECNSSYVLTGGQPAGGIYNGTGVTLDVFDPSIGVGNYTIDYYYVDNNGCNGFASAQMTVLPSPVTSLNSFANVCSDAQPFALTGGLPSGGVYIGQGITNGTFDPAIGAGTYYVTYYYEDSLGCGSVSVQDLTVDICTGISDINSEASIALFPNPAKESVTINFNTDEKINSLEIFTSSGALIYSREFSENNSQKQFEIDLKQFSSGAYILRANSENGVINKKLMIE